MKKSADSMNNPQYGMIVTDLKFQIEYEKVTEERE